MVIEFSQEVDTHLGKKTEAIIVYKNSIQERDAELQCDFYLHISCQRSQTQQRALPK